jgi:hypothetical protein
MLQVSFKAPHLSIACLDEVELPMLTIICGRNGAGKTHLLQAIEMGRVVVCGAEGTPLKGKVYDFLRGQIEMSTRTPARSMSPMAPHAAVDAAMRRIASGTDGTSSTTGFPNLSSPESLAAQLLAQSYLQDPKHATVREYWAAWFDLTMPHEASPFRIPAASVVLAYRLRKRANDHRRDVHGVSNGNSALSDDAFLARYGPDPLHGINEVLVGCSLCLSVASESVDLNESGELRLQLELRNKDGLLLSPEALSTGESTLLAMAASRYHGQTQNSRFPELLLLDEAASHLHPAEVRTFLRDLDQTFVTSGIGVLLTTHAANVVALAPEGSTFIMQCAEPRLRPSSRDRAIGELTLGVPSLRIETRNCRQSLVEGAVDQGVYQQTYEAVREQLIPEVALAFIPSSMSLAAAGSAAVRRQVTDLWRAGCSTIRGVLDWDLQNKSEGPIVVFGEGERYSIENAIADPLLVALLLVDLGVSDFPGPKYLRHIDPAAVDHLQVVADEVSRKVVDRLSSGAVAVDTVEVSYSGGIKLRHPAAYLHLRGHDLLDALLRAFPELHQVVKQRSTDLLSLEIARRIVPQFPTLVPAVFVVLFRRLQEELPGDMM